MIRILKTKVTQHIDAVLAQVNGAYGNGILTRTDPRDAKHKPARQPAQKEERNQRATHRAKCAGRRGQIAAGTWSVCQSCRSVFCLGNAPRGRCLVS